ncbi:MAG: tRNA threonylcarbamoyladenosine dehydratase [Ruminococcaceae bacterium]|nr:tRNA threonylcarbamoyladenosine dehydratase [Oscillospiraceae bacterium]
MSERNKRTSMLIGEEALEALKSSRVAVFGLGGVGGHALEALVRAGVGAVDIFDNDTVSESNINRQIIATYETLGKYKTDAFEERIRSINPDCSVTKHTAFVTKEKAAEMSFSSYSYVIDAIDTVSAKIAIAERCEKEGVPLISSMGTGNKLDASKFEITDIYKTSVCPLARVMRAELKKRGVKGLKVLYSREEPIKPRESAEGGKKPAPASISFVPSVAGLLIAGEVVRDIIGRDK